MIGDAARPGPDWDDVLARHLPPGHIARLRDARVGIAGAGFWLKSSVGAVSGIAVCAALSCASASSAAF